MARLPDLFGKASRETDILDIPFPITVFFD